MAYRVVSADIALIAAAVRSVGRDRVIVNEMAKEIRRAGPPIRKEVRAHILATLPASGGLNKWVARSSVRINVRRGPTTAGVSVRVGRNSTTGRADLRGLDSGQVRHPLYGNRKPWYDQGVTPLSISEGISVLLPVVIGELISALERCAGTDEVARQVDEWLEVRRQHLAG